MAGDEAKPHESAKNNRKSRAWESGSMSWPSSILRMCSKVTGPPERWHEQRAAGGAGAQLTWEVDAALLQNLHFVLHSHPAVAGHGLKGEMN